MKDMVKTYVALNNWLDGKRDQKTYSNQDPDVWKLIQHAKKEMRRAIRFLSVRRASPVLSLETSKNLKQSS